jgi:hypothetical protein
MVSPFAEIGGQMVDVNGADLEQLRRDTIARVIAERDAVER